MVFTMKTLTLIIIIFLIELSRVYFVFGAAKIIKEGKPAREKYFFDLNTKDRFSKVKPVHAYAFMIGNDNYTINSDFDNLAQCYNDVRLLKGIFLYCARMKEKDIYTYRDMTLKKFKSEFDKFVKHIKEDDPDSEKLVIITYSGHGREDGALAFVDGGFLKPQELKDLINTYKNDTVLIIDACYSGNNEGPKEVFKTEKKSAFKSNTLRIYASLAHLTAKEIKYSGAYFKQVKPFYRNVLGIKKISGNGYFTAMIGLFFAEYKLKPGENVSFKDLVSYVTNKGKQYVEYLALKQSHNAQRQFEAGVRLNQQPKVLPIKQKVDYIDVNHKFILIQTPILPTGFEPGISVGTLIPFGRLGGDLRFPILFVNPYLGYELKFIKKNLFLSFSLPFMISSSDNFANRRDVSLMTLAPALGFYYRFFRKKPFNLLIGADGGIAFTFVRASSFGPLKEVSETFKNTYISVTSAANFEVDRDFDLFAQAKFIYIGYADEPLTGISLSVGANYFF